MKKVISTFFIDKNSVEEGWLREFSIIEDVITSFKTVKARILCIDGKERWMDYSFGEFEFTWKINLSEINIFNN